jgi:poly-gamma-glutamate capsule biosynthesis protein CapA/YwtB (metallophosphatase superfamily)
MRLALAGDTMLGRTVAARVRAARAPLFADEVVAAARSADLLLVNLECCVSERGSRWPAPGKPFFFRAPPAALAQLRALGVDAVALANNHALDYGPVALEDTLAHLAAAGIAAVGAGHDRAAARRPLRLSAAQVSVEVVAVADHPADFAAGTRRPGIAYADLRAGPPPWLLDAVASAAARADAVLVSPHWGPNMTAEPLPYVRTAAAALVEAGATIVAGHSAHVFHGVAASTDAVVCYDLGDFLDDYAVHEDLRNDLGLLWFLDVERGRPRRLAALPLALDHCFTRLAEGAERDWIARRLDAACRALGTTVRADGDLLEVSPRDPG